MKICASYKLRNGLQHRDNVQRRRKYWLVIHCVVNRFHAMFAIETLYLFRYLPFGFLFQIQESILERRFYDCNSRKKSSHQAVIGYYRIFQRSVENDYKTLFTIDAILF